LKVSTASVIGRGIRPSEPVGDDTLQFADGIRTPLIQTLIQLP
jgi:hypothetical protein